MFDCLQLTKNMTRWEKIHGHFDCDELETGHTLNCSQILDRRKLVMSPITGLVTVGGESLPAKILCLLTQFWSFTILLVFGQ